MIPDAQVLPDKAPTESVVVEFPFDGELTAIDGATLSASVAAGADANPGALFDGPPQIQGANIFQRISGGIVDTNYKLICTATHGDDVRVLAGILPVRAP